MAVVLCNWAVTVGLPSHRLRNIVSVICPPTGSKPALEE